MNVAAWPATKAPHGRPALAGPVLVLDDEQRAALRGHEAARLLGERTVGAGGVVEGAELGVAELAHHRVRGQRRLRGAHDHDVGAAPHGPARVREGVQTARLVARHHPARPLEAAADGDLAGARGVEPGDGLVGADELGALPPQFLQLALAELAAARPGGGDHADGERIGGFAAESGVVEGEGGGGHREVAEPVGLHQEPVLDEGRRVEGPDLARHAERQMVTALAADQVQHAEAFADGLPVGVGPQSVGRDHTDAGDGRAPGAPIAHRVLPPGPDSSTADWKPPNPLPTESTWFSFRGRAVRGT
ncbi:hypothetical protein GCM10023238_09500 [Streptomyces heliomycini]